MTTEHNSPIGEAEAVRLIEQHATVKHYRADGTLSDGTFWPADVAALIADVRQQAMEEAAGVCDRVAFDYDEQSAPHHMGGANTCAAAIRARLGREDV
jgi:hypothetical protein